MTEFEKTEAHHHGDCGIDCPICAVEELNRLASLQREHHLRLVNLDTYFIAPDQAGRGALWRLGDADDPQLVVRKDQFADAAAWELLEVGVRVAQVVLEG